VSLIGHGNVSLDVARMLLTPASELARRDVPSGVLDVLARSSVKHVSILGRRGPLQASFTNKEVREMMRLKEASMDAIDPRWWEGAATTTTSRQQARLCELLKKGSTNPPRSTEKTWSIEFFKSPVRLSPPSPSSSQQLATLELQHTTLDPLTARAVPTTGQTSTLATSLVITSLGFHADPSGAFFDPASGHVRTRGRGGRVVTSSGEGVKGVYASGWAGTGAKGVLAATMVNANEVAQAILEDGEGSGGGGGGDAEAECVRRLLGTHANSTDNPPPEVEKAMGEGRVIGYREWKLVDDEEVRRGEVLGKERERMGSWLEVKAFLEACK
jgi:adrenodoxin-NADP+ reductase